MSWSVTGESISRSAQYGVVGLVLGLAMTACSDSGSRLRDFTVHRMVIANFDGTQETISDVGELEEAAPWTVIVPEQSVVPEWDIVLLQLNKADETAPSEAQESRTRVMVSFSGDGSGLLLTQFGELPDYGTPADATEEEVDIAGVSGQYITSPAGQTLRWSACSTGFDLTSDARLDRAVMFDIAESINTAC